MGLLCLTKAPDSQSQSARLCFQANFLLEQDVTENPKISQPTPLSVLVHLIGVNKKPTLLFLCP